MENNRRVLVTNKDSVDGKTWEAFEVRSLEHHAAKLTFLESKWSFIFQKLNNFVKKTNWNLALFSDHETDCEAFWQLINAMVVAIKKKAMNIIELKIEVVGEWSIYHNTLKKCIYIYLFIYFVSWGFSCHRWAPLLQQVGSLVAAHGFLSCSMYVGSSYLTRDRTHAPCIRSVESYPLCHQGSPLL